MTMACSDRSWLLLHCSGVRSACFLVQIADKANEENVFLVNGAMVTVNTGSQSVSQHDDDYYPDLLLLRSAGVRDGQTGHHYGAGPELCKWARRTRKGMLCFAFLKGVENRPTVLDPFSARYDNHCQFVHLITII
jgi:hypothetical protein